ncbi:hypothetical protein LTS01_024340 [Friedmanniomyces endolithicus]|nr:hypothetical protein LTS01_024340 [Friedmanniomyces endolithicus]
MCLQVPAGVIGRVDRTQLAGYGVVLQIYDPMGLQPVVGAKAYYLRIVLHDYSDEKCVEVLKNLRLACAPDSLILIDEMVLRTEDAQTEQTQPGLRMLSYLLAMERDRTQWEDLLSRAGLQLRCIYTYDAETGDSVIAAPRTFLITSSAQSYDH